MKIAGPVRAAAAGDLFSLFVKNDGTLWGMGLNDRGQLGDGSATSRTKPVQVAAGVEAVTAGLRHGLFLKTDGTLWGMGYNQSGELGDGTTTTRLSPVQVTSGVAAIAAGAQHSLFLKTDGTLWAMGNNISSQLGDGATTTRLTPVQVASGVAAIAAGAQHSLFLKTDGTLWAMGNNGAGQLGDGTTTQRSVPLQVSSGVIGIAAGAQHSLFLRTDETLWVMGRNILGQLGDGTTTDRYVPVRIGGDVMAVAGGGANSYFIRRSVAGAASRILEQPKGRVLIDGQPLSLAVAVDGVAPIDYQWRRNGEPIRAATARRAQFYLPIVRTQDSGTYDVVITTPAGSVTSDGASVAVRPRATAPVILVPPASTRVSTGQPLTLRVSAIGSEPLTYTWRKNGKIVQRSGAREYRVADFCTEADAGIYAVEVSNSAGTASTSSLPSMAPSEAFTLFIRADGELWGMGANSFGQLGTGDTVSSLAPSRIAGGVRRVATGLSHSLFVSDSADLWVMGRNVKTLMSGRAPVPWPNPSSVDARLPINTGRVASYISAGISNSFYLDSLGKRGDSAYLQISAAGDFTVFLDVNNRLLGEGLALPGAVTAGQAVSDVLLASDVAFVSAGTYTILFIKTDGSLWGFGRNTDGQLGEGTPDNVAAPVLIDVDVVQAAAGLGHIAYIKADKSLWTNGANDFGQLGDGTRVGRRKPAQVANKVTSVACGRYTTLYVDNNNQMYGFGSNQDGQLGLAERQIQTQPTLLASGVRGTSEAAASVAVDASPLVLFGERSPLEIQLGTTSSIPEQILLGEDNRPLRTALSFRPKDTSLAQISPTGVVTALKTGETEIEVSVGSLIVGKIPLRVTTEPVVDSATDRDLSVAWIQRVPSIDYVPGSADPTREGWPTLGSTVTWRAAVKNWMRTDRTVEFRWSLDGSPVGQGSVVLRARSWTTVDLPREWSFKRETLKFEIDTGQSLNESSESNNSLEIFTDAISLGLWVEESLYNYFHQHQWKLGDGANGWEDWAQRQVRMWNEMFARSVWLPDAPTGVRDRIRLDKITLVPNGALPLAGGLASNNPDNLDRSVDLVWGFDSGQFYADTERVSVHNPFYYEGSLIHELGHARYLIDTYAFNVQDTASSGGSDLIKVRHQGALIAGTPYLPRSDGQSDHFWLARAGTDSPFYGLMGGSYSVVDTYSAVAMNLIAGRRATSGNFNSPGNIGSFINDLPSSNRVTLLDGFGNALAGAKVTIFRSSGGVGLGYRKAFDDVPDLVLEADGFGVVELGRNPFHEPLRNVLDMVALVRVERAGKAGFAFIQAGLFNLAYWRGHVSSASYTLSVPMLGTERGIAFVTSWPEGNLNAAQIIVSGDRQPSAVSISGLAANYRDGAWVARGEAVVGTCRVVATWDDGSFVERSLTIPKDKGMGEEKFRLIAESAAEQAPTILSESGATVVEAGKQAVFTVNASGAAPLSFQWYKDGLPISSATGSTFTLPSASPKDAGTYRVRVSNRAGTVMSTGALLSVQLTAPSIATQPSGLALTEGQSGTLSATANGTAPLSYQWRKDGVAISGAISPTLSLSAVSLTAAGSYSVVVTNTAGSAISASVAVTVARTGDAPTIVRHPSSFRVAGGSTVVFSAEAGGTGALTYQWTRNGSPIPGATGANFTLPRVQSADVGVYAVTVSNSVGAVTSSSASLEIAPAGSVVIATQAVPGSEYRAGSTVTVNNTFSFGSGVTGLAWQLILPAGWSYVSGGGAEGEIKPTVGTTELLEWAWSSTPVSPATFTVTLSVPASETGAKALSALVISRSNGTANTELVNPSPLNLSSTPTLHSADTNRDRRISLLELTRVIELYNARSGSVRTGQYTEQAGSEDGFMAGTAGALLTRYHSADSNNDGRISLLELTRVIELYNYRQGTVRTGQYRPQSGTEDGFAPGP
jgi:alpha-tubulin suppressor-like RCC1 family protein